jgi:DNA replication protein DnaC
MDHDHLLAMLNRLTLTAIRDQLDGPIDEAARCELTIQEGLSLFCEREIARKDERRIEMSIGLAHFPFVRDFDGFDFAAQPLRAAADIGKGVDMGAEPVLMTLGPARLGVGQV